MPRCRLLPLLAALLPVLVLCAPAAAGEEPLSPAASAAQAPAPPEPAPESLLQRVGRGFSLHRQNYVLPLTWGNVASSGEDAELKFQLSFKQRLFGSGFYLAYTQKSFWRLLDQEDSRPFRETNHNPELFYRLSRPASWGAWGGDLGFEHESNGAPEPTSRSWDRLFVAPFVEVGRFRADLRLWHRLSEEVREFPGDPAGDENPDITDFYGYGEMRLAWELPNRHMATAMGRWNPATGKGGMQLDYSVPFRGLFLFGQLWTGYGESLIDYNRSITRYGAGLMFKR